MSDLSIGKLDMAIPDASALSVASLSQKAAAAKDPAATVQAAKDFESVLLGKLMEEMQKTVQKSGLLDDEGADQIQSIFWMQLSQDLANKGGIGLWKQIYQQMNAQSAQDTGQMEQVR